MTPSAPSRPKSAGRLRTACRYGAQCYQASADHSTKFAHPGDQDFRNGMVELEQGLQPDLRTIWDIFVYFDPKESGHLFKEDFLQAAREVAAMSPEVVDIGVAWAEAGGADQGHVSFVRFANWCACVGLRLPVGLDTSSPASRSCRFGPEDAGCNCEEFVASSPESALCKCGHRRCLHRSDSSQQTLQMQLLSSRPVHWKPSGIGLIEVTEADMLSKLQFLLDATHRENDNWTRDRGCAIHGINACETKCVYAHRAPVPAGYRLVGAWRNQNPALWARYSLMRATIQQECAKTSCTACAVESSARSFDELDTSRLTTGINEWRLFHGTSDKLCREICDTNFNLGMAGTGATWKAAGCTKGNPLYGAGVYLAERITKADEYARQPSKSSDGTDVFSVLLCRAVGGSVLVCAENEIDSESLRRQVLEGPYHSVLGDRVVKLRKPYREVVIYDRDQLYPEFLLTYARIFGDG